MQEIWDALAKRGHEEYGGELVTQLEHGRLNTCTSDTMARTANAPIAVNSP